MREAEPLGGFNNRNYPMPTPSDLAARIRLAVGTPVKVRIPERRGLAFDQVLWSDETSVLRVLSEHLNVPQVLARKRGYSVQTYLPGRSLADRAGEWGALRPTVLGRLPEVFAKLAAVPPASWPALPADWPASPDCTAFLDRLVRYTEQRVERPAWQRYGELFAGLGIPRNAMEQFRARLPELRQRPFVLLHADLHPGNLVLDDDGELHVLDWELAMAGDPLHDLAIHLERTRYPNSMEEGRFVAAWRQAVREVHPGAVVGLNSDLRWYRRYQRVRSVYTDVVRIAEQYRGDGSERACERAAQRVSAVLRRGMSGLKWGLPAPQAQVEAALAAWGAEPGVRERAARFTSAR